MHDQQTRSAVRARCMLIAGVGLVLLGLGCGTLEWSAIALGLTALVAATAAAIGVGRT